MNMPHPVLLRTKLLRSVCFIVTVTVTVMLVAGILVERRRFRQMVWEEMYQDARALGQRMGHLLYAGNLRYLMVSLKTYQNAHPDAVYVFITDPTGKIQVADWQTLIGSRPDTIAHLYQSQPCFTRQSPPGPHEPQTGKFEVHEAVLRMDLPPESKGPDNPLGEYIFEARADLNYMGRHLGTLHLAYPRDLVTRHLTEFGTIVVLTGALVLAATLLMLFWVIRRSLAPLDTFVSDLERLHIPGSSKALSRNLADLDLEERHQEVAEIRHLKRSFSQVRSRFMANWEQLEQHRNNLEQMVARRTRDLNAANVELNRKIKERKEIEARMLTIQKMESIATLAGGIAHEFNNLFMAITGNASLIQARTEPGHPNMEKAEKIRTLVETGAKAIQQLLGFARIGKYAPGPLNMNQVVRSSLEVFSRSRKDLELATEFASDPWTIVADHSQMEQVVMNLLVNASDAMPGNSRLSISTRNQVIHGPGKGAGLGDTGRFICLTVADQGPGIDPEVLPRIFDPFFTTKKVGRGSGLGLASVYGIVENHGGFTRVESEPGAGTRFLVFLPALAPTEISHEKPL